MALESSQCDNEVKDEFEDTESGSDEDTVSSEVIVRLSNTFNRSQLCTVSQINRFLDLTKGA